MPSSPHYELFVSFKGSFILFLLQAHSAGAISIPDPLLLTLQDSLLIYNNNTPSLSHINTDSLILLYNNLNQSS